VGWVIALWDKYSFDIYFRSQVHIATLQFCYLIFLLLFFWLTLNKTYAELKSNITSELMLAVGNPNIKLAETIPGIIQDSNIGDVVYVFFGLALATVIFNYTIALFTFKPIGNALNLQKRFIGNIAHELRTPLSLLKTNTEVALITENPSESIQEMLNENIEEIDRISNIINNLLSLNALFQIDTIQFVDVRLKEILEASVQSLKNLAKSHGVKVKIKGSKQLVIHGNKTALEQLVTNLVKNAIIYTPKNKNLPVYVCISPDKRGHINLTVKDRGIGIEQKELFRILEPFYRAEKSRKYDASGSSGLGLTIVNEIAKHHKASVFIKSAVGQGTSVRIRFPEASHWLAHSKIPL